eukprot:887079-Amphidinium_carterae.1
MGYATGKGDLYEYNVPAYVRQQGKRTKFINYGVEPWTLVEKDMQRENLTTAKSVKKKLLDTSLPDHFWQRPEHQDDGAPLVPLSLFIDGLAYARKQSMLVVVLHNMLTKKRYPMKRHDHMDFHPSDAKRLSRRGQQMPYKCVVLQLRLDWAEWSHSIGVMSWKSTVSGCPFCT